MPASRLLRVAPVAAASLLLALPVAASGQRDDTPKTRALDAAPWVTDGFGATRGAFGRSAFNGAANMKSGPGQHGPSANHLPAARENMELVGKLELSTPEQYRTPQFPEPLLEGQIADLAIHKKNAYLASWSEPSCRRGGFFSADISNPASPRQTGFTPALPGTYHGEGMHAITVNTSGFQGDILAVNNEPCSTAGTGGFDLYDVSNPANPRILIQGAGDKTPGRGSTDVSPADMANPAVKANSAHSIFIWQDGGRAFAVIVDNTELTDVDIFDITNPGAPVFIADIDLVALADAQGKDIIANSANGDSVFHHDMVVKRIGSIETLLVSYWDAGYVKVNVNDPANPVVIGDSDFDDVDPLTGLAPPEGNGHQSEFSHDNRFVLAADEDFSTYRTDFRITSGPNAGEYESGEFGFTRPIATLPDKRLNGPTVFGGRGCTTTAADPPIPAADSAIPPGSLAAGEEQIVVISRGSCRFDEKIQNAENAGYEGIIIGNSHVGSDNGASPDATFCGSGDTRNIRAMCIGHRAMHLLFNDAPSYTGADGTDIPLGAPGEDVAATATYDGWGYTHLYRNNAGGDLERVDSFAIEEALDERYAFGFGDLSVHEHATDPAVNLSYVSYYAGGVRVLRFGDAGMEQTGKFIDEGGSNFWGVEQLTADNGERLIAGSDRDFGLYLLRYTGPDAVKARAAAPPAGPPAGPPVAAARGRCKTLLAVTAGSGPFSGSPFGDQITGTDSNDVINGLGGDDCIDGLSGADTLRGGTGVDTIDGQRGNDRLIGGSGRGNLRGGTGNDRVTGGSAQDVLFGNTGHDRLSGGRGADQLFGGAGRDRLTGSPGKDIIEAGTGNDRIFAKDGSRDMIDCGFGRDTVVSRDRFDRMTSCERR